MPRNYKQENVNFNSRPGEKKRRAGRNAARRKLEAAGRVERGDGRDIDHVDGDPRNNALSNLRITSKRRNRSRNRQGKGSILGLRRRSLLG